MYLPCMELDLHRVDAFTHRIFSGNPACVMPLTAWLDDGVLLDLARENAVAETAFLVKKSPGITTFAGSPPMWKWTSAATPRWPPRMWS